MSDGELNIDDAFVLFDLITGIDVKGITGKAVTKVDGKDSAKNVANYPKLKDDLKDKEKSSLLNADNSTFSGRMANGHSWEKHKK